ncbi:condensation domain-containing protein, partial [Dyella sp.]|uniref:condensation domain-containing protein n=1 Tax=Dyella sp. TaxID=1869338 RepID=UPI002B4A7D97
MSAAVNELQELRFRLSAGQRGRWFLYQLEPGCQSTHNISFAARLSGPIAHAMFDQTFQHMVDRHPMLRASFETVDGEPWQRIAPHVTGHVQIRDASSLSDIELLRLVRSDSERPFDLAQAPLMRICIYQRSETDGVILFSFDHLIGDGWSYWRFMHEFGQVLASCQRGGVECPVLADIEASYAEYVHWQRSWLDGAGGRSELDHWRNVLQPEYAAQHFPADRLPGSRSGSRYATRHFSFRGENLQRLMAFCQEHAASCFLVLLAVFEVFLSRHLGHEDVVIGSMMPARRLRKWRNVFGDFANPVVLRTNVSGAAPFHKIIEETRSVVFRAMSHQDLPFSTLIEHTAEQRSSYSHPLFQTAYVFQKARGGGDVTMLWGDHLENPSVHWGDIALSAYPVYQSGGNAGVDLVLEVLELEDCLRCSFNYDEQLFDERTIDLLIGRFTRLMYAVLDRPRDPVGQLTLLSEAERRDIIEGFNATQTPAWSTGLVHELFEAQAERTPDAVA